MEQYVLEFLQILEAGLPANSPLLETSVAGQILGKTPGKPTGGKPGTREVIDALHKKYGLSHNQKFDPIQAILFADLKSQYRGAWALVIGDSGTGAIKWNGNTYQVLASNGNGQGVFEWENDRGGALKAWMKQHIGSLRSFYVATDNLYAADKKAERKATAKANAAAAANAQQVTVDTLVMRFKPMWSKYVKYAEADIRGMIKIMLDNGAYDRAGAKLQRLQHIMDGLRSVENDPNARAPGYIKHALNGALAMTAHQFYPEETGEITRHSSGEYRVQIAAGIQHILDDIKNGDSAKIGVTLRYFKRTLL
jgi:hypothetical protein